MTLTGKVAVVAGATRGCGRGIAVELGAAGATVYCTGRSTRAGISDMGRAETLEETAEQVTAAGGVGIPVRVDHTQEGEVRALFERVQQEQGGLDILVNDVWGGDPLTEWGQPFWDLDMAQGWRLLERAIYSHLLTARHGVPLLLARGRGLVVEVTDGDGLAYRGNLIYDLAKTTVMRLAQNMAADLAGEFFGVPGTAAASKPPPGVTALAVTPGYLRSEAMLEHFGVTEATWQDAIRIDPNYAESETPRYLGRAVAALAADPNVHDKAGRTLASWTLADEYGFTDVDGRRPHWGRYYAALDKGNLDKGNK